jgi:hypothetical protein
MTMSRFSLWRLFHAEAVVDEAQRNAVQEHFAGKLAAEVLMSRRAVHRVDAIDAHSCPGAPLARSEARISFNRILDRIADIRIDEAVHGTAENRNYTYDPTFIMRGLSSLHVDFTPVATAPK